VKINAIKYLLNAENSITRGLSNATVTAPLLFKTLKGLLVLVHVFVKPTPCFIQHFLQHLSPPSSSHKTA
jgi:hypothetical protein